MRPHTVPGMPAVLTMTVVGFAGYAALLAVAPLWAVHGGADTGGAGLVNGVLLLVTVLTQSVVPAALRRVGWGPVLVTGLVFLGGGALLHLSTAALGPTLAFSAVRGVGFGILTVAGSAAVAELTDPSRRGAAVGLYGLAIAVPQVVLLPTGPWVAERVGFWVVFLVAALPLVGVPPALSLARTIRTLPQPAGPTGGSVTGAATGSTPTPRGRDSVALLRPMFLLIGVTLAGGAVISFAPQMTSARVSVTALAVLTAVAAVVRWRIGHAADRWGAERFLWPLVIITVASMALAAFAVREQSATLFILAAAALGIAYGGLQNLTLVISFAAVHPSRYGTASAVWNIGFDVGAGVGSVLVGFIAVAHGFPTGLLVAGALALLTLPLAVSRGRLASERRAKRP